MYVTANSHIRDRTQTKVLHQLYFQDILRPCFATGSMTPKLRRPLFAWVQSYSNYHF